MLHIVFLHSTMEIIVMGICIYLWSKWWWRYDDPWGWKYLPWRSLWWQWMLILLIGIIALGTSATFWFSVIGFWDGSPAW